MNQESNLKMIKKLWSAFAAYYQLSLSDQQIQLYAEDCSEYSADAIGLAMKAWRRNPKHSRLPLPGQLLELMNGSNSRLSATAIATNMIAAVQRHDYTWPQQLNKSAYRTGTFGGDFRAELGEAAWEVMRAYGDWAKFCEAYKESNNETAFKAQLRDLIESVVEKRRSGDLLQFQPREAPQEISFDDAATERLSEIVNRIGNGEGA